MGESTDCWAREGKWKFFGGSAHCIERYFRLLGSLLLRLNEGQLTSASWAHLTVKSYGSRVKNSSCVHWKSEEHNSDRWFAFQNRKRDDISNEKHTHRSRFSPAMPRTSFPDNLWKSPLLHIASLVTTGNALRETRLLRQRQNTKSWSAIILSDIVQNRIKVIRR